MTPAAATGRPLLAFAWMLGAIASFSTMTVAGRQLQAELSAPEVVAWRSLFGFVIVCAAIRLGRAGFAQVLPLRPWLHVQRNLVQYVGQVSWFSALMLIPMAQLTALEFTAPIWVALLAPLLLAERLTPRRALAVALGFLGVLIVVQPGTAPLQMGHALALLSALSFAVVIIWTRRITAHDTVLCVMFWMTASHFLLGLLTSLALGITWPSAAIWPWIGVIAVVGLSAHFCLANAFLSAPVTMVAPMEFLRLPVIATVGALVYAEAVTLALALGAAVILTGNLVNLGVLWPRRRRA